MYRKLDDLVNEALQPDDSLDFNSKVDEAAVRRLTHKRLGLPVSGAVAPHRPKAKALRRVLAFAAVAGILTVGAFAAAELFQLGQAPVEHFGGAASVPGAQNRYESLQPTMEQMTTTANLSQTVEDVTITLQTVTADSNSLNLAFAIENPNLDLTLSDEKYPDWYKAELATPFLQIKVAGEELLWNDLRNSDSYVDEAGVLHALYHVPAKMPLPNQFMLELQIKGEEWNTYACLPNGASFAFALEIDRGTAAVADKLVVGQAVELGQKYPLQLLELRQSGLGTMVRYNYKETETESTLPWYCVRDEAGNILTQISYNQNVRYTKSETIFGVSEVLSPTPDSASLTFVPVVHTPDQMGESRKYNVANLGAKIETSELGGYTLTNYQVAGSRIKLTFTPYGYNGGLLEAIMVQPEEEHYKAIMSQRKNYQDGTVEVYLDYYEATEEELKALESFTVYYQPGYSLDEANAVTLPFGPVQ